MFASLMSADTNDDLKYWLGLNLVEGLGPYSFRRLYAHFGSARAIWNSSRRRLRKFGLSERACESLARVREERDLDRELKRVESLGIRLVKWGDRDYPSNLRNIPSPPFLLYIKGEFLSGDELALAVVGTRKFSAYGKRVTTEIVRELAASGLTIVSGLALGIDSFAHRAALSVSGRTIAVLGCGLDRIYPPENRELAREIERSGALVSEFPLGFPPVRGNFPSRNRIIAGLSLGTLVCEAPERSGALITAACALEQGKPVFAVPGSILNQASWGVGRLIQSGAKLVLDASDILEELSLEPQGAPAVVRKEIAPRTAEEKKILEILRNGALNTDQIVRASKLPVSLVLSTLTQMAMRGMVEEEGGGRWIVR